MLSVWKFLTIVLTALALTMTSAHVLELLPKMGYDAQLYSAVNTTLYRYFAIVGGFYSVGSIVAAAILAVMFRRRRRPFRWALAAAFSLVLWLVSWLALVAPVNNRVAAALQASPEAVPVLWMQLRGRWEYGHLTGFVIQFLGFCALVISVLVDTPAGMPDKDTGDGRA